MTRLNKAAGKILYEDVCDLIEVQTPFLQTTPFPGIPSGIFDQLAITGTANCIPSYKPNLPPLEAINCKLKSIYILFLCMGFLIYVKERNLRTNDSEFKYNLEEEEHNQILKKLTEKLKNNYESLELSLPAQYAIGLAEKQAKRTIVTDQFSLKGHRFLKRNMWTVTPWLFIMGYNFAHEMIFPQLPVEPNWPRRVMKGI